ncbi:MAG: hypothetical protein MR695_05615 [Solobacterium sp.]|nr:hypothetical protein [Solobacterium sp.]
MDRGVNTTILNAKDTLAETINNILKDGVPPIVVSMIVEGLYNELDILVKQTVEKEQEQFQSKKELEDNQVLYKENNREEVN